MSKRLFIIDGTAVVYRSYFAFIRNPLINSKGENTSAAYGFASTVLRIIKEEAPDYLIVAFDSREPTFRHKMYTEYKATREKMPDDLVQQLGRIEDVVEALNLNTSAIPGYEADDIMGTLASRAYESGLTVYLVTGDKDLMQLVNDRVFWLNLRKSGQDTEILDPEGVKNKFGVPPEQIIEVLALMGDSSDNVPGVSGVGPKTALKLIGEFGTLENVLDNIGDIKQKGLREKLERDREQAILSKELVTIDTSMPLDIQMEDLVLKEPDTEKAVKLFQELESSSLINLLPGSGKVAPREEFRREYFTVTTEKDLSALMENLKVFPFVFDLETTGLDTLTAEIVGLSFSFEEGRAFYVPVTAPELKTELSAEKIFSVLKPVFEDEKIKKAGQNIKFDMSVLLTHGIEVKGADFDTMIAAYLIEPVKRQYGLDSLSLDYLQHSKIPTSAVIGTGKNQINMSQVPLEKISEYACEDADYTFRLWKKFEPVLEEKGFNDLFSEVEMPLVRVLMDMEREGVSLDVEFLERMAKKLQSQMKTLEQEIYQSAGEEFNIGSPQQLGKVLFENLEIHKEFGIKRLRKTTLGYSTDISILEQFTGHPLIDRILEYRQTAKLFSTYVDALPKLIHPDTGRVHTSFNQTIAATGRLSSSNPNLQNIPIRRAQGREIRKAFIPRDSSSVILSADYSQIELRIMAHLSGDAAMQNAFIAGQDIHAATASKIFNVDTGEVTQEMRYRAKAINFGILYGMSAYRLAREEKISVEKAQDFVAAYFETFPGVNSYRINQLALARELGFVVTMMGRRRYLPDLDADNQRVRQTAENIAINTPIQGTAAELIKIAMIKLAERLKSEKLKAKLVLQIHDELVLELPCAELEQVTQIVKECMEKTVELTVPLVIEINSGENWFDAH